jgi:uncharacterized protein (UPF0333 family)
MLKNQKGFTLVEGLLIFLVVVLLGGAGYYVYSQQQSNDVNESVTTETETTAEETPKETKDTENKEQEVEISSLIFPGQVYTSQERVRVTTIYTLDNIPENIWLEYGQTPDKLDNKTEPFGKGLAIGVYEESDIYAQQPLDISMSDLNVGEDYFFRVGASIDGNTVYSGVTGFTTSK